MIVYRFLIYIVSVAFFLLEATHGLRAGSLARGLEPRQTSSGASVAADSEIFIGKLWHGNSDMVDQFLNNEFVRFQAQNPDEKALPSYRHYSLQDYYYLLDFVKYRALRLAAVPDISNNTELESYLANETKSMADFAAYSSKFRNDTLVKELKINSTEIENGTRTVAELAYSNWLQKNEDSGWFTLYVKSIPCVYGWQKLAQKLHDDGKTNKSTKFYKTWIEPNMNSSSGKKLSALLDKYVERYNTTYMYSIWNSTFVEALQFEINFFNDSLNKTL